MKLHGAIELHVEGERLMRRPNLWDKLRRAWGGEPDLSTGKMRAALAAGVLVDAVREALARLGVTNAISLVIDDVVLFQDKEGRQDDLVDLFLAFHEHADVFGSDFRLLRLAVEHEEAGVHYVLETVACTEHPIGEPAARLVVGGRLRAFEPRAGEDAEAYRERVEPLTQNPALYEVHRHQFEAFVGRVAESLRVALPEARVELARADALVQKPERRPARRAAPAPTPTDRRYDPHEAYYPNPYSFVLGWLVWDSLLHSAFHPGVLVVGSGGEVLGSADEVVAGLGGVEGAGGLDGDLDDVGDGDVGDDVGGGDFGDFDFGDFGDF
ncbi:MAG: hypothetical protein FJ125_07870 [Deltaproteobacteria bacterium]|nr:hypothetical protein [Deltaproteobacteria bacterium]